MSHAYSLESVVALATLISLLDFFFIILFVPESLTKTTAAKPALSFDVFKTQEFFKVIAFSLCYVEFFEIKLRIKKVTKITIFLVINQGFHKKLESLKILEFESFKKTSKSVKFRTKVLENL